VKLKAVGIIAVLLGVVYVYPRMLISTLGESSPWTSYLYMYGLGLVVFVMGLTLIRKTGALVPGRGKDTMWWRILIGGYLLFFTLHGLWVSLAVFLPVKESL